ncbi:MAG: tetraacyldisaccharide 4'-kinase [Candidatus Poribacteria bacterium]|nr:tetraacyldisaccharide 4'-kinase [Candidatus Poribacteria bacterium]MDE0503540.1 tetraacyldisaccharide 4'-kinase [Candidatus Poribacteria bacterium]
MKNHLYFVITRRVTGFIPSLLIALLTPLSYIYAAILSFRNWLYDCRLFKSKRIPCTVISVGNIVSGGTGKTPVVIWIAKALREVGYRPAILLRGYHRQEKTPGTHVVSDCRGILASVETSGDEAMMIAREVPSVPVLIGKDRYEAGCHALRELKPDVLILDDGFQHRMLERDLDILTVDATQPFGTGKLLPAGTLREPVSALRRADMIMLTRVDTAESVAEVREDITKLVGEKPIVESRHEPTRLYRLGGCEDVDFAVLKGKNLLAVCGIGHPGAFAETLRRYKPETVELLPFPDHHHYSRADVVRIQNEAKGAGANYIITTRKDELKLAAFCMDESDASPRDYPPILVLAVELSITSGECLLTRRLQEC